MKQKRKLPAWTAWTLVLLALGCMVYLFAAACSFAALGFFGLGGVIGIYGLLSRLAPAHPKAAAILRGIFTAGLCLLVLGMAVTLGCIMKTAQGDPDQDCGYVLILGAGVDGTRPSRSLLERLEAARGAILPCIRMQSAWFPEAKEGAKTSQKRSVCIAGSPKMGSNPVELFWKITLLPLRRTFLSP